MRITITTILLVLLFFFLLLLIKTGEVVGCNGCTATKEIDLKYLPFTLYTGFSLLL